MNVDILSKSRIFISVSLVLVIVSIILLFSVSIPIGIDFASGTSITYQWEAEQDPGSAVIREALTNAGHPEALIQNTGQSVYFIRTNDLAVDEKTTIDAELSRLTGQTPITLDVTTVGQSVASNTALYSFISVLVASIFVMLYVMWAFRTISRSYRYALAALVALLHDVLITMGAFVFYGVVFGSEVNASFIVAILTVIGYSVNDTIVVFDRIRENFISLPGRSLRAVVSISVGETLIRSLGTSITTLIVIFSMLLFGGQTIRDFLLVLATGIIIGTYSSIFIASYLVVVWEERGLRSLLRYIPQRGRYQNVKQNT